MEMSDEHLAQAALPLGENPKYLLDRRLDEPQN
jgi:hypothetical protein